MQKFTFPRSSTGFFSEQQVSIACRQDELLPFIGNTISIQNIEKQLQEKISNYPASVRSILCEAIEKKYSGIEKHPKVLENIQLLANENTFTITTGHQLCLYTGPVYVVYKILHVIKMAEILKEQYPDYNFVPVFWMASEDHDFEEIASVELFNQMITWGTNQAGAVGRFNTSGLDELHEQFKTFFQPDNQGELNEFLSQYKGENLAEATFRALNHLFQAFGLLLIDGDSPELKKLFVPVLKKELTEKFSYQEVKKTSEHLSKEGYRIQVNPREINLFYLGDGSRERIMSLEDGFYIEGRGRVEMEEMLSELEQTPQNFSPNVVLRPLFQETILPNLVYIGGVNELNYWLQLKSTFTSVGLSYPMLCARTSILYIDPIAVKKMNKLDFVLENLFMDIAYVKQQFLRKYAVDEINFEKEDQAFIASMELIKEKILFIDSQLTNYAEAEYTKMMKQYNSVKEKLQRVVRSKHDVSMKQIEQLFERLFPNGNLQERHMGFFSTCSDGNISDRLKQIHDAIDPFNFDFMILRESK